MKTILITDDSATARTIVRRCLDIAGCGEAEFLEASNGEDALELLRQRPCDLLVTDLVMPGMGGKALLGRLAASPRLIAMPVIVVTSLTTPDIQDEIAALEHCALIPKPVNPGQIATALEEVWGIWQRLGTSLSPARLLAAMDEGISRTFEEMIFGEVNRCQPDEEARADEADWWWAEVLVRKPEGGLFTLACPRQFVTATTALLHGLDEADLPDETLIDALAELANVAAGRCLGALLPEQETFLLGVPRTGRGNGQPPAPNCTSYYRVNDTTTCKAAFSLVKEER